MRKRVVANLVAAQVSFFFFLLIAVFMTTGAFQRNHGLSFYGEHWSTAVPYGSGFVVCCYFLVNAASLLPKSDRRLRTLSVLLRVLAALMLSVLLTPDTVNSVFNLSHTIASAVLFLYELSFATWLALRCYGDRVIWLLIALQLAAAVLAMLSDVHVVPYLSEGILFFQLLFSTLLNYSVSRFLRGLLPETTVTTSERPA